MKFNYDYQINNLKEKMELFDATDSEDELPSGWEERVTSEGLVYYANCVSKTTQWEHPKTGKKKTLTGDLPYGWEKKILENGNIVFVDHINKKTSYTDPRLAFYKSSNEMKRLISVNDSNDGTHSSPLASNNMIANQVNTGHKDKSIKTISQQVLVDEYSTASQLLKDKNYLGYCAIVTGGNRGVGFEITKALAYHGCHVIVGCRNLDAAKLAFTPIIRERPDISIEPIELNLSSLESVKSFVDKFKAKNLPLNMLYLNAALFQTEHIYTKDNIETMFQVNYLAQFYLTRLLVDNLEKTIDSRVVVLSCESHRGANLNKFNICASKLNTTPSEFNFLQMYCNSKSCMTLFANEFNRRLNKSRSTIICKSVHPGNMLPSNLFKCWQAYRYFSFVVEKFTKNLEQAAAAPIYLAIVDREHLSRSNFYWNGFNECDASIECKDPILAYRLWEISETLLIEKTKDFDTFFNEGDKFSSTFSRDIGSPALANSERSSSTNTC